MLNCTSNLVDKLWIGDCDLEVWILHITRKPVQVLSHDHLNGVYSRLMLSNLRFEECFVLLAILGRKRVWSCNVEVMKEVGNMQHNRVARLIESAHASFTELDTYLRHTKQFHGSLPIMQRALFTLNLLKYKTVRLRIEVS
jgi:hypothetical protein